MTEPRDLAHNARVRAEMLEVIADDLAPAPSRVLTQTATLLREMAEERERLRVCSLGTDDLMAELAPRLQKPEGS